VDPWGNAYVTGHTTAGDFPGASSSTIQPFLNGWLNAFVAKINTAGSALIYSTYLGGTSYYDSPDGATGIAVDSLGNAYVTGFASSLNFPGASSSTIQPSLKGYMNAFVAKINAAGSALIYSTYLGGSDYDAGSGIAVDSLGNAYVTGGTSSTDFPTTPGAFQTTYGGVFVAKLNAAGSALLYSTYLGGSDNSGGIALDAFGNAYVTGWTGSDFPTTPGAFQRTYAGDSDAFVSKFSFGKPFSSFSGKLELDLNAGSFDLNAAFKLGAGGSINAPIQPVNLTIGTYSVTIPPRSFVTQKQGYAFQGVVNGVSLQVLIKSGGAPGSYTFLAEGKGANLTGTTDPVTVTLSIGNNTGTTQIDAEFQ
jgi:hypothetical protein